MPGTRIPVFILSDDEPFVTVIGEALPPERPLHTVDSPQKAAEALATAEHPVLIIDVAIAPGEVRGTINRLRRRQRDLVTIVSGGRDDSDELLALAGTGLVHRFLLKPLSATRIQDTTEAAVRHAAGEESPTPQPTPAALLAKPAVPAVAAGAGEDAGSAQVSVPAQARLTKAPLRRVYVAAALGVATLGLAGWMALAGGENDVERGPAAAPPAAVSAAAGTQAPAAHADAVVDVVEAVIAAGLQNQARASMAMLAASFPEDARLGAIDRRLRLAERDRRLEAARGLAATGDLKGAMDRLDEAASLWAGRDPVVELAREGLLTVSERRDRLALLKLGNQRLLEGRLVEPELDNARYYYHAALARDRRSIAGRQGMEFLRAALTRRVSEAIEAGDRAAAERWLLESRLTGVEDEPLSRLTEATQRLAAARPATASRSSRSL